MLLLSGVAARSLTAVGASPLQNQRVSESEHLGGDKASQDDAQLEISGPLEGGANKDIQGGQERASEHFPQEYGDVAALDRWASKSL
jgi:hypothetical protein